MRSLVLLYSLMLSSSIILRIKCDDVETSSITPESSASNASDTDTEVFMYILNNNNGTEHDANKTGSNSTISLGGPFGLTIETRSKRGSSTNEPSATSTVDSAVNKTKEGAKDVNQTSTRIEESIREMFLESWGRAKRDTEEEDASLPNNSDAPVPDNSSESIQDQNLNEFASDHDVTVEGDSASDESSKQLDPDSSSTSEEDREERDVGQSEENLEEGRTLPSLRQVNPSKAD